jgi:hypothetical protein
MGYRQRYEFPAHTKPVKRELNFETFYCQCKTCAKLRGQSAKTRVKNYLKKIREQSKVL